MHSSEDPKLPEVKLKNKQQKTPTHHLFSPQRKCTFFVEINEERPNKNKQNKLLTQNLLPPLASGPDSQAGKGVGKLHSKKEKVSGVL